MKLPYLVALVPLVHAGLLSLPIAYSDIRHKRIYNRHSVPMILVSLVFGITASAMSNEWSRFGYSFLLAMLAFIGLCAISLLKGIGMGDVKLITAILLAVGWWSPLHALGILVGTIGLTCLITLAVYLTRFPLRLLPLAPIILAWSIPLGYFAVVANV